MDEQYKDFTFHIHQVRQWVLLTITKTKNGGRVLAAPPMFGRSERLHSWDQYALYLPFFDEIVHHFQDIKDTVDKSSPVRELELCHGIRTPGCPNTPYLNFLTTKPTGAIM